MASNEALSVSYKVQNKSIVLVIANQLCLECNRRVLSPRSTNHNVINKPSPALCSFIAALHQWERGLIATDGFIHQ